MLRTSLISECLQAERFLSLYEGTKKNMKRTKIIMLLACLGVVLGIGGILPSAHAAEIDQMISTAKTASDHEAIAAYYDKAAEQAKVRAAAHERMRNKYAESPSLQSAGPGYARVGAKDCDVIQRSYLNIADEDAGLAKMHREMAAKLGGRQP